MRIVQFLSSGKRVVGKEIEPGYALPIEGDLFSSFKVGTQKLKIEKLLSPIVPTDILCIGLNYRAHAAESNMELPVNPMLFIKSGNTLNNPLEHV